MHLIRLLSKQVRDDRAAVRMRGSMSRCPDANAVSCCRIPGTQARSGGKPVRTASPQVRRITTAHGIRSGMAGDGWIFWTDASQHV